VDGFGSVSRRLAPAVALLCIAWLASACGTPMATPAPVYLRVAGSTSLLPALHDLAAGYAARHPEVTVNVQGSDSSVGLRALRDGSADIAAVSWREPPQGEGAARDEEAGLDWHIVGRDGLVLIVHPQNTLGNVALDKARDLFAGRYATWAEAGGRGGEIQVVSREDGSGSRAAFEAGAMGGLPVTPLALVMPSSAAVVEWVAGHPNAIGYVSMAYITTTVQAVRLAGVEPAGRTVENGSYALSRPLYLVTRGPAEGAARGFVEFCLSPAGQAIVAKYHGRAE